MEQGFIKANQGVFFISKDGRLFGQADYTRWKKCKWWQKVLGAISWKYKRQFVDYKPFKCEINEKAIS